MTANNHIIKFKRRIHIHENTLITFYFVIGVNQISAFCQQVRDVLVKTFVLKTLGGDHLTRNEFLKPNTKISDRLLNL